MTHFDLSGAPQFDLVRLSDGYHGLISEDSTVVEVQPTIRAGPDVCSFRISSRHHGDIPFTVGYLYFFYSILC